MTGFGYRLQVDGPAGGGWGHWVANGLNREGNLVNRHFIFIGAAFLSEILYDMNKKILR